MHSTCVEGDQANSCMRMLGFFIVRLRFLPLGWGGENRSGGVKFCCWLRSRLSKRLVAGYIFKARGFGRKEGAQFLKD